MPSMRTSTRSPGRSGPTPAGVPVAITSPASRVMTADTRATTSSTGKTKPLVLPTWRSSPLTHVSTSAALGSRSVEMHGPMGQKVSKALARVFW